MSHTTEALHPIDLSSFGVHPERGFLPAEDPLIRLPQEFDAWEEVAQGLPKYLVTDRIRTIIEGLTPFPSSRLQTEREWRRAMVLLSYLGHGYVWSGAEPPRFLPAVIAKPWFTVAKHLGRPPVLSYASYALDNWRRFDPNGPIECGNIALLQNFLAGIDEEWFILIHVDIEKKAARAMAAIGPAQQAAQNADLPGLEKQLEAVLRSIDEMHAALMRMPEHCDPYIYFHRVRPYIHGWKNHPQLPEGLIYEGVEEYGGKPQQFRGETGAQSSIIPTLDALLGVGHADDPLKEYLLEMREYMPPGHRAFMTATERGSHLVRGLIEQQPASSTIREVYNQCVTSVERFRSLHLEYAATYIFKQQQTQANNPSAVGTGGTPFMVYLKKHRDETGTHKITGSS